MRRARAQVLALRSALLLMVVIPLAVGARPGVAARVRAPARPLRALRLLPAPGSTGVPRTGLVTVVFDRPVVPLARLGSGPAAATVSPPIPGQQRWLGTTTWAIIPANGLAPATTYTLRLNPALRALDGSTLAAPAAWQFTTLRPAVARIFPHRGARGLLPQAPIDVTFNLPVVHSSAQVHFALRLRQSGTRVSAPLPGTFTWRSARTMRFTPASPLPRGSTPIISESAGVVALGGPLPGTTPFSSIFHVAPAFALSSSDPANGTTAQNPYVTVYLHFTAPVDLRAAAAYLSVQPALAALHVDVSDQDTLTIDGDFQPSTTYHVTMRAGLPGLLDHDRLPATRTITFQTPAYQPSLALLNIGNLNTYDAYRGVRLYADATNVGRVTIDVYRQSEQQFLRTNAPSFNRSTYTPRGLPRVAHYVQAVHAPLNKTVTVSQLLTESGGAPLAPGYYAVFANAPGLANTQYLPLLVTRSSLTLKNGDNEVLLWANDLRSGAPLANLPVRVRGANGALLMQGRTGSDGVYVGHAAPGVHLSNDTLRAFLDRPGDVAAAGSDWDDGISPYDYNLNYDPTLTHVRLYLNTDRPIYRPGQTVYVRGLVRGDDDGRYHMLPAGTRVHLVATDALNHTIFDRSLPLNAQGVVAGHLALSDGASLGGYSLEATVNKESTDAYFTVAAYKKPTFQVTVSPNHGDNGSYVQGQTIGVTAHADYYFGAPVPHAPVQWTVSSAASLFQPAGYDLYSFVDQDVLDAEFQYPTQEQITQLNRHTGPLGGTTVRISTALHGSQVPRVFTVEANVTGPSGDQVAQDSSVTVNPADVYVGLRPQQYLATPGAPTGVDVVTLHPDGTAAPRTVVTLMLQRREVYSVLQYDPEGGYLWQDHTRDVTLRTFTLTTAASGHTVAHVTLPRAGEYRLAASARDSQGNTARTAAYLYSEAAGSSGYVDWGMANNDRIQLVADRRQYLIGQTAHILVSAPYPGMRALVTLERGTILSHRVLTLRGNSPVLSIPVTAGSVPNVYVSVVLFKGSGPGTTALPIWKMGYTTLVVNPQERALTVSVRPLQARARPGETVRFAIHTVNWRGQPVSADVGVSLVDAAVLALAANENGTATDAFYAQRPLGISTAASMSLFIDRLNLTPGNGQKGGGGGGPASVRTKFPDTAYWNPNVMTDAHGNATVTVTLPDNLTTWHFSADGSTTGQTLLGSGSADLLSTKPLLIEPALPRFLAVRDRGQLGAIVSNTTGTPLRVRVDGSARLNASSTAAGAGHTSSQALAGQEVTVPAHADRAVYWSYAPQAEGTLAVTLRAAGPTAALSDALAVSLPVEQNSLLSPEAAATAGDVTGAAITETVRLPGQIEPGEGDLRLTLEPSLVAGLAPAASALLSYPYDSVEQLTSRLTGLLALALLPRSFGLSAGQLAGLPDLVTRTTSQLYAQQNGDGGWGWWSGDESDPYLSAYVYEGLLLLREAHYAVDKTVLASATGYLQGQLAAAPGTPGAPDDATRAFIVYVLGRAGRPDAAAAVALYARQGGLGPGARAQLALGLSSAFGPSDPRVRTLLRELADSARLTSVDAHWDAGATPDWETMESSVGDTALVLRTLITLDPHNPLIARAARWLVAQRGLNAGDPALDGAWQSTQATALALRSLVLYALQTGDTHPRYSYRVLVDGQPVQQGTVTPDTAGVPRLVVIPASALRVAGGRTSIAILRRPLPGGPSLAATPLHYTLRLRYYPAPGSVGAVQSGILVARRYLTARGAPVGTGTSAAAPANSTLTVELRLVAPQDLSRVLIEDPLPAGAEAVDGTLLTSSIFAQPGSSPTGNPYAYTPPRPGQPQDLSPYVDHVELRDDRAALFASTIPAGTYVYRYTIHLTMAGLYHVLPAYAQQLYEPEVFGHTAEDIFSISS